ncbi:MAG: class I SAM-dependent methyltransferase [Candidatus Cloacimonadaceae bacterium]
MQYDPIKDIFNKAIGFFPPFRRLFFRGMDLLLLRQRYVKKEIREYLKDGDLFYDAGAGFCQYSDFVLRNYPKSKVFAVDLKDDYLREYSLHADDRFYFKCADLQEFTPKKKYKVAIAIDILEHIPEDRAAISNIYEALSPGGTLIISSPSDLDEAARFTAEHVRPGYSKEELEDKLREAGFEIIDIYYSYGKYGALSWKILIQRPLKMIRASKFFALLLPFYYIIFYPIAELLMQMDLRRKNKQGNGLIAIARKESI